MTAAQSDCWSTGNNISDTLWSDITLCYLCPSKGLRPGTTQTQCTVMELTCGVPWSPIQEAGSQQEWLKCQYVVYDREHPATQNTHVKARNPLALGHKPTTNFLYGQVIIP